MKKVLSLILVFLIVLSVVSGCSGTGITEDYGDDTVYSIVLKEKENVENEYCKFALNSAELVRNARQVRYVEYEVTHEYDENAEYCALVLGFEVETFPGKYLYKPERFDDYREKYGFRFDYGLDYGPGIEGYPVNIYVTVNGKDYSDIGMSVAEGSGEYEISDLRNAMQGYNFESDNYCILFYDGSVLKPGAEYVFHIESGITGNIEVPFEMIYAD